MKVAVTRHYAKDDPECIGEYRWIDVIVDEVIVKTYGDYNDRGKEKADGFIDGLTFGIDKPFELQYAYVADSEY